jgi:serine/threonine protein phosphatase PrpC
MGFRFMDFLRGALDKGKIVKAEKEASVVNSAEATNVSHEGLSFVVGKGSHIGKKREHNEDAFFTLECTLKQNDEMMPFGLFIIADGMGGHQAGDVASALATRVVAHSLMRQVYLPFLRDEERDSSRPPINEALIDALSEASLAVYEAVPDAGTTLTAALIVGTHAYIGHVGDSRAYLVTEKGLQQITQDHSLVARLIELGQATPEEAMTHPQRNVLYRALGQGGSMEVDTYFQLLPAGSQLLLCSDGLWGAAPEREMAALIAAAPSPQIACRRLIEAAITHGGEDNITMILIAITDNKSIAQKQAKEAQ